MADFDAEARSIFLSLVDRPQDEWLAALAELWPDRPDVRAKVERLLADHLLLGSISPDGNSVRTNTATSSGDELGTVIAGHYKLLEPLGEGGFGVVYLAEQTAPVRRKVALKILKAGMETRQVVARFEAERQALAIMDHPNIARVFDGGVAPSGRPFFAMEYVKGVPITEFCDQHKLTPQQRLELFVDVCQAVQHAHQKGIIHRDIKPSNVLVSRHDTTPVVKVIDFGVAKALGQELTDKTLFTNIAQMVGTPLYMSPEQAGMSDLDVDTRSDIYSLGVLLYELLTGTTPFSKERFKQAAYDEIRRIIREEDPPKPSTRISESTESLPSVAANRGVEPKKLGGLIRGELDWIVMKALEKDRNRRYETANGFAGDVLRYLVGEAVLAVPPSTAYQMRKFIRKHRALLSTAGVIAIMLIGGVSVSAWQATRARLAENKALAAKSDADEQKENALHAAERETVQRKKAQAKEAEANAVVRFFEERVFSAGRPKGDGGGLGHDVSLRDAIRAGLPALDSSFQDQPLVEARLRLTQGAALYTLGEYVQSVELLERARNIFAGALGAEAPFALISANELANSYAALNRHADALKLHEETLAARKRVLPPDHPFVLVSMNNLANSYAALNRHADALRLREETLAARKCVLPPDDPDTLMSMLNLANSYAEVNRHSDAAKLNAEALAARKRVLALDHPDTLMSMNNLANNYAALNRPTDAIKLYEETLSARKRVLPPDHLETLKTMHNLANNYSGLNRYADAIKLNEETLAAQRRVLRSDHPDTLRTTNNLANNYAALNRFTDAVKLYEETLAAQRRVLQPDHPDTLTTMNNLANGYAALGRLSEAAKLQEEVLAARKRVLPPDHPDTLMTMNNLANSFAALNRRLDALRLHEETLASKLRVLSPDHPETLLSKVNLAISYVAVNRHADAVPLLEEFLTKANRPGIHPRLLPIAVILRFRCARKLNDIAGLRSTSELAAKRNLTNKIDMYNCASFWAVTAQFQSKANAPDAAKLASVDADKAMGWLQKAIAAGWTDAAHIRKDSDLDYLRSRDDYQKLIADLETKTPPKSKDVSPQQKGK